MEGDSRTIYNREIERINNLSNLATDQFGSAYSSMPDRNYDSYAISWLY